MHLRTALLGYLHVRGLDGRRLHDSQQPRARARARACPRACADGRAHWGSGNPASGRSQRRHPDDAEDAPAIAVPLPAQQPLEDPFATPGMPEETAAGVAEGRPNGIEPAAPAAFWIWRNAAGIWKLRTTTGKALREFRGRVKGVQKPIGTVRPSRTEFADRIKRGTGGEVIFRFHTLGHIEGFDFRAPADACVRFDLQLDSGATAKKVHIGKASVAPKTNHFTLCPAQ